MNEMIGITDQSFNIAEQIKIKKKKKKKRISFETQKYENNL